MSQTISITEARDNFPALIRRMAEQAEAVVVTRHNQPRVVLLRWETYQAQQQQQAEGAIFLPLLRQTDLTSEVVANVVRTLAEAGVSSVFSLDSALVTYYQQILEEGV